MTTPTLPNGATILEISYLAGVVLARNEMPCFSEYITWEFYGGDLATTAQGHYFSEDLVDARKDYNERVKRAYSGCETANAQAFADLDESRN